MWDIYAKIASLKSMRSLSYKTLALDRGRVGYSLGDKKI